MDTNVTHQCMKDGSGSVQTAFTEKLSIWEISHSVQDVQDVTKLCALLLSAKRSTY